MARRPDRPNGCRRPPPVGGHEGAGVVTEVGEGVTGIAVGDHVVLKGGDLLPALLLTGKGRRCVVVGLGNMMEVDAQISILDLTVQQKTLQGAISGGTGPRTQVPHLLHQYRSGALELDELVTRTYRLEEINQHYQDMRDGKNLRGVIVYDERDWREHADPVLTPEHGGG